MMTEIMTEITESLWRGGSMTEITELLGQTHDALTVLLPEIEAAEAAAMLRYADILAELEQLGRRHKHTRESLAALERLIGANAQEVAAA